MVVWVEVEGVVEVIKDFHLEAVVDHRLDVVEGLVAAEVCWMFSFEPGPDA